MSFLAQRDPLNDDVTLYGTIVRVLNKCKRHSHCVLLQWYEGSWALHVLTTCLIRIT